MNRDDDIRLDDTLREFLRHRATDTAAVRDASAMSAAGASACTSRRKGEIGPSWDGSSWWQSSPCSWWSRRRLSRRRPASTGPAVIGRQRRHRVRHAVGSEPGLPRSPGRGATTDHSFRKRRREQRRLSDLLARRNHARRRHARREHRRRLRSTSMAMLATAVDWIPAPARRHIVRPGRRTARQSPSSMARRSRSIHSWASRGGSRAGKRRAGPTPLGSPSTTHRTGPFSGRRTARRLPSPAHPGPGSCL